MSAYNYMDIYSTKAVSRVKRVKSVHIEIRKYYTLDISRKSFLE